MRKEAPYTEAKHRLCGRVHAALPDSISARKQVLQDIITVLGETHPLHQVVAQELTHLQLAEHAQAELNLKFQQP